MSETIGTPFGSASAETTHEAYSFVCLSCGHGWEQSFDIAHHVDEAGRTHVTYYAGGQRMASPLTRPSCHNCGGHLVRIMRSGRVQIARGEYWQTGAVKAKPEPEQGAEPPPVSEKPDEKPGEESDEEAEEKPQHHWLAELLHIFHRKHRDAA